MISGMLCAKHASDASGRYEPKADIWCHAHATATRTHVSLASMFYAYAGVGAQCGAFVHDQGRVRMYARMHAYSRSHACVCVCRHTRRVMVRTPIVLPMRLRWTGIGAESSPILSIEMYTARSKTPFASCRAPINTAESPSPGHGCPMEKPRVRKAHGAASFLVAVV